MQLKTFSYIRRLIRSVRYYALPALLLIPVLTSAQNKYTISGSIRDRSSGEHLIGAVVRISEQRNTGTVSNEYGFYSLTLPEGDYTLVIGSVGYGEMQVKVRLDRNIRQDIVLDVSGTELTEVTISDRAKNSHVTSAQMGMEKLNIRDVNLIPVLFGEKDILKTIQLLPGVKSSGDGGSGFNVRGGTADQNLILLDEAVVYNPSHLLGFFSTFNSDAIKDVTLYKGAMPAQYGGRVSSVLDVKMNDGNNKQYHASGSIGLISSKLNLEGPIVKDRGSFLISGRRTYADLFLKLSNDTNIRGSRLYFYDLNTKLNYKLSAKDRLYLSGYFGQDNLGLRDLFGINWGNATGTLRWNHIFNEKVFSNTSVIFSDYNYNIKLNAGGFEASIHSEIRDWNFKEEIQFFPNPRNSVRIGLNSIYHTIIPGEFRGNLSTTSAPHHYSWENALYVTNSWKAAPRLNIDYGIRASSFSVLGGDADFYELDAEHNITDTLHYGKGTFVKTYVSPEPRLSASLILNDHSSVKVGYARNAQYLHLITNSTTSNPTDKWVQTNNIIRPELSDQVSAGYFRNFRDGQYEGSIEAYYKSMQNQIDYRDGAEVLGGNAIEPELLFGEGRAYGVELLLKKRSGKLTGWISYTLARTEKRINNINNNDWYPARQDRTHDISIVGMYSLSKRWNISGTWVYYTGNAVSFPSGKYEIDNQVIFYYTERNGYRMPAYHRLDLGATCLLKQKKRFTSELTFSLYNAYGRQNAYAINFESDPDDPDRTRAVKTSLFRWVPSISYNFKF